VYIVNNLDVNYLKFQVIKRVQTHNLISKQTQILIKPHITETDYLGTSGGIQPDRTGSAEPSHGVL